MDTQEKIDRLYLRMAFIWAENSYAIRRKVGCLVVKNHSIISDGYNGTPIGFPNVCEYVVSHDGEEYYKTDDREELIRLQNEGWKLVSYPIVLHAESNALTKLAKSNNSCEGATIYITDEPCVDCAKLIIQSGIKRVVYSREDRLYSGLELLKQSNIDVQQIEISVENAL